MPRHTLPNLLRLVVLLDHRLGSGSLRLFVERWPRLQKLCFCGFFDLYLATTLGDASPLIGPFGELRLKAIVLPLRDPGVASSITPCLSHCPAWTQCSIPCTAQLCPFSHTSS
jgi:hypothetical protein